MNIWLERAIVTLLVAVSVLYALKMLLPFGWRVAIARWLAGRVPDSVRIWIAGKHGCDACGVSRPPISRR
ncbi:MAG: hypothetical protein WCH32_12230 [Pseudomonadota bacterium]